jgi:hypothetical protein
MSKSNLSSLSSSGSSSSGSSSSGSSSSVSYLDHFQRPVDIYHCIWNSASNVVSGQSRQCPHECACEQLPDPKACQRGYIKMGQSEIGDTTNQHQRTVNPNQLISWCFDPKNMDPQYQNNVTSSDSWIVGCLSGIRGYHKVYRETNESEPCENLINQVTNLAG